MAPSKPAAGGAGRVRLRERIAWASESFPLMLAAALTAQLVILTPVLNTAFWEDDDADAYTKGYIRWVGDHFWHFISTANSTQVNHFARLLPLGVIQTYGLFDLFHDRVVYKLILIALTLVASALVALVVRRLGASPAAAALAAALPAVAWQLHLQHDPLISYVGLVQAVTIYTSGMILTFIAWLRRGNRWWLVASMALLVAANLTYQDAYLFPLLLIPVTWRVRGGTWWKATVAAAPALALCFAFLVMVLILGQRLPANSTYSANYAPGTVISTWAKIVTSGLPLIGWADSLGGPRSLPATEWGHAILRGLLVGALLFGLVRAAARPAASAWVHERRTVIAIALVAGLVMLTPSALTSLAPQYQDQIVWGWGYLPMFFAVIGWAILVTIGLAWLLGRLGPTAPVAVAASVVVALAGGTFAAFDAEGSARVVAYMQPSKNSRDLIEASFAHGILATVPTHAAVLWYAPEMAQPTSIWVGGAINLEAWAREFVNRPMTMRLISPTAPSARVCTDATGAPSACALLPAPTFWLRTTSRGPQGFVAIAPIATTRSNPGADTITALTAPGSQPIAFVEDPRITAGPAPLPFTFLLARPRPGAPIANADVPADQTQVLRRGAGWALVRLAPPQAPFVAASIGIAFG